MKHEKITTRCNTSEEKIVQRESRAEREEGVEVNGNENLNEKMRCVLCCM